MHYTQTVHRYFKKISTKQWQRSTTGIQRSSSRTSEQIRRATQRWGRKRCNWKSPRRPPRTRMLPRDPLVESTVSSWPRSGRRSRRVCRRTTSPPTRSRKLARGGSLFLQMRGRRWTPWGSLVQVQAQPIRRWCDRDWTMQSEGTSQTDDWLKKRDQQYPHCVHDQLVS